MVEIAKSIEVFSGVSCTCNLAHQAWSRVSVGLIRHAYLAVMRVVPLYFVGSPRGSADDTLLCKIGPRAQTVLMVDDNILDKSRSFILESLEHMSQFGFCSPTTVMIKPETWVVSHRLSLVIMEVRCLSWVWNPYQTEEFREFIGLVGELAPGGNIIAVPIETLQHNAVIMCRPALRKSAKRN